MRRAGFQGFNIWAVSLNLLVMALRAVPSFMKYLTIKDLITHAAEESGPRGETVTDLRVRLAKLLNTNQIYDTSFDEIEVYREPGAIAIEANYEKRFPLF